MADRGAAEQTLLLLAGVFSTFARHVMPALLPD